MQGLRTHDAMKHSEISLSAVWNHFINMGGAVEEMELDAYLHGMMPLPLGDRDCVTQAVNELLEDRIRAGASVCCRAPWNAAGGCCGASVGGVAELQARRAAQQQLTLRPRSTRGR